MGVIEFCLPQGIDIFSSSVNTVKYIFASFSVLIVSWFPARAWIPCMFPNKSLEPIDGHRCPCKCATQSPCCREGHWLMTLAPNPSPLHAKLCFPRAAPENVPQKPILAHLRTPFQPGWNFLEPSCGDFRIKPPSSLSPSQGPDPHCSLMAFLTSSGLSCFPHRHFPQ